MKSSWISSLEVYNLNVWSIQLYLPQLFFRNLYDSFNWNANFSFPARSVQMYLDPSQCRVVGQAGDESENMLRIYCVRAERIERRDNAYCSTSQLIFTSKFSHKIKPGMEYVNWDVRKQKWNDDKLWIRQVWWLQFELSQNFYQEVNLKERKI